jgi:cellulose synthase/poly-beta-1,6-N-acetylglucosamine synthase-like glycosyltransferase
LKISVTHVGEEMPTTRISVIVAARNESANILACLKSIKNQTYPTDRYEIILVDDHSTDSTMDLARQISGVHVVSAVEPSKKAALTQGIAQATGELIVTTDADCIVSTTWLQQIADYKLRTGKKMICGPVVFDEHPSFVQGFQALDFLGMIAMGAGAIGVGRPLMCNGANLAYDRDAFIEVGGFEGIDQIASGDDMLLLHKIDDEYPGSVGFLKSRGAMVSTGAAGTWKGFLEQRIRWSSKSFHYERKGITLALLGVYLFNLSIVLNLLLGLLFPSLLALAAAQLLWKVLVEFPLLAAAARHFRRLELLWLFLPAQAVHILYVLVVGLMGVTTKYKWKERLVR